MTDKEELGVRTLLTVLFYFNFSSDRSSHRRAIRVGTRLSCAGRLRRMERASTATSASLPTDFTNSARWSGTPSTRRSCAALSTRSDSARTGPGAISFTMPTKRAVQAAEAPRLHPRQTIPFRPKKVRNPFGFANTFRLCFCITPCHFAR